MKRFTFKEIVKKNHLTYKELMKILNKSKPTIQTYMSGRTDPDLNSYIAISEYLNIGLDELIGRENSYRIITIDEYNDLKTAKELLENILKKY